VGRATLAKSTLSAIPVHTSICCALSPWAIREIDKRRRAFLWAGADTVQGGNCRVAWPVVCLPKELGGLGLPDLKTMGAALRLRWEWQRRNDPSAPWAGLPCRTDTATIAMFRASVRVELGSGDLARFWTDNWLPCGPICLAAPDLFSAVGRRRRGRSVREALMARRWTRDITGATTAAVIADYLMLWDVLQGVQLQPGIDDRFIWKWSANGTYDAASAYRAFFHGTTGLAGAREVWRVCCPPKVKFFFWLALRKRLWTAERRWRHGLQQHADCLLCGQEDETCDHLLVACVFSREIWYRILSAVGSHHTAPSQSDTLVDWWLGARKQVPRALSRGFDSLVLLVSWELWKERNRRTFDGICATTTQVLRRIRAEGEEWIAAGFSKLSPLFALASG